MADGSDFVSSACLSFWCALVEGRLHSCDSRDDLWPLLVSVTMRKANHHARLNVRPPTQNGTHIALPKAEIVGNVFNSAEGIYFTSPLDRRSAAEVWHHCHNCYVGLRADEMRQRLPLTESDRQLPKSLAFRQDDRFQVNAQGLFRAAATDAATGSMTY